MSDERNPRKKAGNNNIGRRASSKYSKTPRNSENRNNGYYYKSISHNEPVQNRAQSKHYESSYIKKSQSRIQEPVRTQVPRRETASKNQGVKYTAKNFLRVGGIKIRRGALDYQFLLTTIILVAFGMIMLYSASSSRAYAATGDSMYFMKSQFGGLLVGIVAMIGCMKCWTFRKEKLWKRHFISGSIRWHIMSLLIPGFIFLFMTVMQSVRWLQY